MSLVESCTNIAVGYLISVATNYVVLPLFGYQTTVVESFQIGAIFSIVSIARSYILRRIFNAKNLASRHHEAQ